uniref:Uncharacterized protein n=1 Tax=Anguilla anguilla TaxID=7936 RepID=A0A0E9Q4G5_ANGAN
MVKQLARRAETPVFSLSGSTSLNRKSSMCRATGRVM